MPTTETAPSETKKTTGAAAKGNKPPKPLPAPNSDFYYLTRPCRRTSSRSSNECVSSWTTRSRRSSPTTGSRDAFPFDLLPAVKELGIGGVAMKGYGCAGGSLALLGFVQMEIARVDPSFSTFLGVHIGLAMGSIYIDGSEEQKQKWLPPMARFEKIGCFGLTEPLVGSGASGGLMTTAKRDGDTWILNGEKRWIGNAPWCDVSIIWARDVADQPGQRLHRREQDHAWLQRR